MQVRRLQLNPKNSLEAKGKNRRQHEKIQQPVNVPMKDLDESRGVMNVDTFDP
jgi:hypothetical protein